MQSHIYFFTVCAADRFRSTASTSSKLLKSAANAPGCIGKTSALSAPNTSAGPNTADDSRTRATKKSMVEDDGIEPTTPCLQSRCSPS